LNDELLDLQGGAHQKAYSFRDVHLHFVHNNTFRVQGSPAAAFTHSILRFSGVNWFDVLSSKVLFNQVNFSFNNYVANWIQSSTVTFRNSVAAYNDAMLGIFQSTLRLEGSLLNVSSSGRRSSHGPAPFLSNTEPALYVSAGAMHAESSAIVLKNMDKVYFLHSSLELSNTTLTLDGSNLVLFESTLRLNNSVIRLKNGAKLFFYSSKTVGDAYLDAKSPIKGATLGSRFTALQNKSFTAVLTSDAPK
jgi:hypothetical protein